MADILALVLPFFGLILIGYVSGRITRQPAEALGWLNFFVIYVTLPSLFFKLVSRTPIIALSAFRCACPNASFRHTSRC